MARKKKKVEEKEIIYAPIDEQPITETLEQNYMPYAMSVIVSRAIPEIDGLKPAHRSFCTQCIQWDFWEENLQNRLT